MTDINVYAGADPRMATALAILRRLEKVLLAFVEEQKMSYSALNSRIDALVQQGQETFSTLESAVKVMGGLASEAKAAHEEAMAALELARNGDPAQLQAAVDRLGAFGTALDENTQRLAAAIVTVPLPQQGPQAGSLATADPDAKPQG